MSLASVRADLAARAPDLSIVELDTSTATVALAAAAHGVLPSEIAKTLSLKIRDDVVLVVLGGDVRLDARKVKARFGGRWRMLDADEVLHWTGHPPGGVCPFGLAHPLPIYLDRSLARHDVLVPAAGDVHAAVRIATDRLAALTAGEWVDVGAAPAG